MIWTVCSLGDTQYSAEDRHGDRSLSMISYNHARGDVQIGGEALGPIRRFRVDFPEEVLFVPRKEGQPGVHRDWGWGAGRLPRRKGKRVDYKGITYQEFKL